MSRPVNAYYDPQKNHMGFPQASGSPCHSARRASASTWAQSVYGGRPRATHGFATTDRSSQRRHISSNWWVTGVRSCCSSQAQGVDDSVRRSQNVPDKLLRSAQFG